MPSKAMLEGRRLVDSHLPPGFEGPDITVRLRKSGEFSGPAITIWPHRLHSSGGEYRTTVVVPWEEGRRRDLALIRLEQLVSRWVEIEQARRTSHEERMACDEDEDGNSVDDDMPTPAWKFQCPLPLRRAMDLVGMPYDKRCELVETSGSFEIGGFVITIFEVEKPRRVTPLRSVRRIRIATKGVAFNQGVNNCHLKIDRRIPETSRMALDDMPVGLLIDMPGLDHEAITVMGSSQSVAKNETTFTIARAFSLLGDIPGNHRGNEA